MRAHSLSTKSASFCTLTDSIFYKLCTDFSVCFRSHRSLWWSRAASSKECHWDSWPLATAVSLEVVCRPRAFLGRIGQWLSFLGWLVSGASSSWCCARTVGAACELAPARSLSAHPAPLKAVCSSASRCTRSRILQGAAWRRSLSSDLSVALMMPSFARKLYRGLSASSEDLSGTATSTGCRGGWRTCFCDHTSFYFAAHPSSWP